MSKNVRNRGGVLQQRSAELFIKTLNHLSKEATVDLFMQCNTSERWCQGMEQSRPYVNSESLFEAAVQHWKKSSEADLLEAFDGHPEIGDVSTLREKYKNTAASAGHEQSGVNSAKEETLQLLAQGNKSYKEKFGFIFIVCASGKSAAEMLALLQVRLPNSRAQELKNAAEEQRKITHIRLDKLLREES